MERPPPLSPPSIPSPPFPLSHLNRITTLAHAFAIFRFRSFTNLGIPIWKLLLSFYHSACRTDPFYLQLSYFLSLAFLGSLVMLAIDPRDPTFTPRYVDMLYMSASAVTVSGLNSVDMERFSEAHLVVLTVLMLLGGEVFVSLLGLSFRSSRSIADAKQVRPVDPELGEVDDADGITKDLNLRSLKLLVRVVLGYVVVFHALGILLVFLYFHFNSSSKNVLKAKGLRTVTVAASTVVSSFANGGILAANENMAVFKKNSLLQIIIIPLMLGGNTLYPLLLRSLLRVLRGSIMTKREELEYIAKGEVKYNHLLPRRQTGYLGLTVAGFLAVQTTLFCAVNWRSEVLSGLGSLEKVVSVLFQSVSARHAGEGALDFSLASPAVVILFITMMYLPSYTLYLPEDSNNTSTVEGEKKRRRGLKENMNMSQLSYVIIFVMMACIIERRKLSEDPLNFSSISMVFETVSAYGNVGLSMGYSCGRQINPTDTCKEGSYSFSGRWSDAGKVLIVFVMLFGRLKRFHMGGGMAWRLTPPPSKGSKEQQLPQTVQTPCHPRDVELTVVNR